MYNGIREVVLDDHALASFYENQTNEFDLLANEYLIIKNTKDEIIDKFRWNGTKFEKLKNIKFKNANVQKPLDDKQLCAYDALFNQDIKVVCLVGKSGTGKTNSALMAGVDQLKQGAYEKIFLVRHAEEAGNSIGLLPGDKIAKLVSGWAGAFYDNLIGGKFEFEEMIRTEKIEIESISLIKGRNLKNCFVIFDECEDAFPEHIELVGTRICSDSKLIFVGDDKQVSKQKYANNSGLLKLIEKAKGKEWFSAVELVTNGRSEVANFFATEYKE